MSNKQSYKSLSYSYIYYSHSSLSSSNNSDSCIMAIFCIGAPKLENYYGYTKDLSILLRDLLLAELFILASCLISRFYYYIYYYY